MSAGMTPVQIVKSAVAAAVTIATLSPPVGSAGAERAVDDLISFDGGTGLERIERGVWHRGDDQMVNQTWTVDG